MNRIFSSYFKANTWVIFAIIIVLYFLSLHIELNYIFNNDFYFKSFENSKDFDSIQNIITNNRNEDWLNYPITFIVVLFPTLMFAFSLNVGVIFNEYKTKFIDLFKITLKAQLVFALNYFISTILKWQGFVERDYGNINNNYDFQSIVYFFQGENLPLWALYSLQQVNITEIIHILVLSYGFAWITQKKYIKSLGFVMLFYGVALIVWIVFTVFLHKMRYN